MKNMDDSMAHPLGSSRALDLPAWKSLLSHGCAFALAVLFITSGVWKIMDPFTWRTMVEQLEVPYQLSMALTLSLGISETLAGVLVVVPRFRRWGAWLCIALLVAFMLYMGVKYPSLAGKDCSCFPWMERTVSAEFFIGDALMLLMAAAAGVWSRRSDGVRSAMVVLGAIAVFAAVSFGVNATRLTGTQAPENIVVDGKTEPLRHGRVFLFFYDPQCMHCDMAAKKMSKYNWGATRVIALPTGMTQYAAAFLRDTGLQAGTSMQFDELKKVFPFGDPPHGVALEHGRQKGGVSRWEDGEPETTLRSLGMIE
jgi:uncharacterized membrane protein YphA (DoxX/SURF4 family)